MANVKISDLTAAAAATSTQQFEVNDSAASKSVTGAQIKAFVKDGLVASDITDLTATAAELNILDGVTATTAELNILDGVTATTAELNFVDGVTSAIQTQLNAKADLASPALTGTPTAPTAAVGTNTTQIATTAYVNAEIANDAPTKTGGGASGTWGISITGNAATATTATTVPDNAITAAKIAANAVGSSEANIVTATQAIQGNTGASGTIALPASVLHVGRLTSANATLTFDGSVSAPTVKWYASSTVSSGSYVYWSYLA